MTRSTQRLQQVRSREEAQAPRSRRAKTVAPRSSSGLDGAVSERAWWNVAWLAGVFILLSVCYFPAFSGPLAFDDFTLPGANAALPSWQDWMRPETRPLVALTFALESRWFEADPFVHRFGNLIIHSLSALLLSLSVKHAFQSVLSPNCHQLMPVVLGFCVGAVWALHPLQTESVAYIVQRGESLMGLFFLSFIYCLVRDERELATSRSAFHHPATDSRSVWEAVDRYRWQLLAVLCFLCGLWSKTVMISSLVVGPFYDRAFLSQSWREVFRCRGWLYVTPVLAGVVAVVSLLPGIMRGDANVGFGGDAPPLINYLAGEAKVVWLYVGLALLPSDLSIDHGVVAPAFWHTNLMWIILSLSLILGGLIACFRQQYSIGFILLSPLLILAPTSTIIPTADLLVEHRMYLPLSIIIGGLVAVAGHLLSRNEIWFDRRFLLAMICWGLALSARTWLRAADYESGVRLWSQAVKSNPENDRAIQNLMDAITRENRTDLLDPVLVDAIQRCEARGIATTVPLQRLGESLVRQGRQDEAIAVLRKAIDQDSSQPDLGYQSPQRYRNRAAMHVNLAIALVAKNELTEALQQLELSFAVHDESPDARAVAGSLCVQMQRPAEARIHWERALELRPDWPQVSQDLEHL